MGEHKDVNLQAGDKINLYDKSRAKNHVFHVFEEPDGDRSWYSIQDKDGEDIFDTGEFLTGDMVDDALHGKPILVDDLDGNDPEIDHLMEDSDVKDYADLDETVFGVHNFEYQDVAGRTHNISSEDGEIYHHEVSDPTLEEHYQLTNIERNGKEIYNAKQAQKERAADREARQKEIDKVLNDPELPF